MKRIFKAIVLVALISVISVGANILFDRSNARLHTTIEEINSHPLRYVGKEVFVQGYLREGIGFLLYSSEQDADTRNYPAALAFRDFDFVEIKTTGLSANHLCLDSYIQIRGKIEGTKTIDGILYYGPRLTHIKRVLWLGVSEEAEMGAVCYSGR